MLCCSHMQLAWLELCIRKKNSTVVRELCLGMWCSQIKSTNLVVFAGTAWAISTHKQIFRSSKLIPSRVSKSWPALGYFKWVCDMFKMSGDTLRMQWRRVACPPFTHSHLLSCVPWKLSIWVSLKLARKDQNSMLRCMKVACNWWWRSGTTAIIILIMIRTSFCTAPRADRLRARQSELNGWRHTLKC